MTVPPRPQPGSPDQAHRLLPLGSLGTALLAGAVFCLIATLLFVRLAAGVFSDRFVTLDDQIVLGLRAFASPTSDQIMRIFTTFGDPFVLGVFLILAGIVLLRLGRWIDAGGVALAAIGGGILNQVLKALYERARPELFPRTVEASGYSFPSGHAMGSIMCYGILAFVIWRILRTKLDRGLLLFDTIVLVFSIGLSRVYFGVHFPTDIIGGYVAGAIWLVISITAVRVAEWNAERRKGLVQTRPRRS